MATFAQQVQTLERPRNIATVSSTIGAHSASELEFSETLEGAYFFKAQSSDGVKVYECGFQPIGKMVCCDCPAAKAGRPCWHIHYVEEAYALQVALETVTAASDEELLWIGKQAADRVKTAETFWPAATLLDRAMLTQARREFRKRLGKVA